MTKFEDLTGKRFGRLTALEYVGRNKHNFSEWLCQCDCGNIAIVTIQQLKSGKTKSCGCLKVDKLIKRSTVHNKWGTKLHYVWLSMKQRCYNPNQKQYRNYGGRGITVCDEWKDNFQAFYDWAINNGYKENAKYGEFTIDRIDVNKNYCPENCQWITLKEQSKNTTKTIYVEYNGKSHNLMEWSEILGISHKLLYQRLKVYNFSVEKAFTMPIKGRKEK